jgi:hypothetical protein
VAPRSRKRRQHRPDLHPCAAPAAGLTSPAAPVARWRRAARPGVSGRFSRFEASRAALGPATANPAAFLLGLLWLTAVSVRLVVKPGTRTSPDPGGEEYEAAALDGVPVSA